jgi:anti-anti-sigma factor
MFQVTENPGVLQFTISSEMPLVDRVVAQAKDFLTANGTVHHTEFAVVMRELLINAIEHGNGKDRTRKVQCAVAHLGGVRWQITVIDEGAGFDWQNTGHEMPADGAAPRSRGLALVHAFTDQVEYKGAGNEVDAFMTIISPTTFAIGKDAGWTVVTPSGDLTAASADAFRQQLLGVAESGARRVRLDLASVQDLDSVSLSVLIAFAGLLAKGGDYQIEVVGCSADLANLFHLTRVDQDFRIAVRAAQ